MEPLPDTGSQEEEDANPIVPIPPSRSLFMFKPNHEFRVFCHWFCNHKAFANTILLCIMISSASLAAEDPLNSKSPRNVTLGYFDVFFTTIFTVEIVVKVVAYGAVFHPGAYCRSPANILDLLVVSVSLISLTFRYCTTKKKINYNHRCH